MNTQQSPTWLDVAREALMLHDFAARHYVLQPPIFKASTHKVGKSLEMDGMAVLYLRDSTETFFGYADVTPADALIRAIQLRNDSGASIEVGAKANPQYDAVFASLSQHIGERLIPQLFNGAVAFTSLEAYVSVYSGRPTRLLQPSYRKRMGFAVFAPPSWQAHERFNSELKALTSGEF